MPEVSEAKPGVIMIAGFGDNASMYAPLQKTDLAQRAALHPLNLPGFGAPVLEARHEPDSNLKGSQARPRAGRSGRPSEAFAQRIAVRENNADETTLARLGEWVAERARTLKAETIIAHSVASIIASLAAGAPGSPLKRIISLEGNLTAADAYFSGRAAEHDNASSFRDWFLPRVTAKGESDPIMARYAAEVEKADPQALWELGCDARRFSEAHHPGERLMQSASVTYVLNRANCAQVSLDWLDQSGMARIELPGASHWPTLDQPAALSEAISAALGGHAG